MKLKENFTCVIQRLRLTIHPNPTPAQCEFIHLLLVSRRFGHSVITCCVNLQGVAIKSIP